MRSISLILLLKTSFASSIFDGEVNVYGKVPGLSESQFYRTRLRKYGTENWEEPFTFATECTAEKLCNTTNIFDHLQDLSNCYINFEMKDGVQVEIEVTKLWGEDDIHKAVVHPIRSADNCEVRNSTFVNIFFHKDMSLIYSSRSV